jgi:hypothetical protein
MNFKNCLYLAIRLSLLTLNLPLFVGILLVAVIAVNSFFGYLNGTCVGVNECLVVRVVYETQQPKFWKFILAMWGCNLFIVLVAIFYRWRRK